MTPPKKRSASTKRKTSTRKKMRDPRFVFVTGGVCSSLGKGIASASIGAIMKASGLKVFIMKLDPYLNVDPGTMNPFQHGEVYVTDDGAETDLDLGHYERFIDEPMNKFSTLTSGQVYQSVLAKERKGDFLGGTIQVVPHITNAIKKNVLAAAEKNEAEVMMVEIGGTVGDIEGEPFLEAIRQLKSDLGADRTFHVHLTLLPYLEGSKELKTKPTQLSVRELRRIGLHPDMIMARADKRIPKSLLRKISLFCDVPEEAVIPCHTMDSIYDVPREIQKYDIAQIIAEKLKLGKVKPDMKKWAEGKKRHKAVRGSVPVAIVGKYTHLEDAYLSVIEAIKTAAVFEKKKAEIVWVDAEKLEENDEETWKKLKRCKGIVVPGGFGLRGIEGKLLAAKHARTKKIPYLGLCLGSQILAIDFARAALKDPKLTSEEFDEDGKVKPDKYVVHFLPGQHKGRAKGGTLRLGAYECKLRRGTKAQKAYGKTDISERHRHRYEFNNDFKEKLESKGLIFSGEWPGTGIMEIVEIEDHPFMLGSQFHPEFKSRPHRPHPLFAGFMEAVVKH